MSLSTSPASGSGGGCRRWIDEAGRRVLPLEGPLTRAAVLVDRRDSFVVYACLHHAIGDAWGINLALSQMLNYYVSDIDTAVDDEWWPRI